MLPPHRWRYCEARKAHNHSLWMWAVDKILIIIFEWWWWWDCTAEVLGPELLPRWSTCRSALTIENQLSRSAKNLRLLTINILVMILPLALNEYGNRLWCRYIYIRGWNEVTQLSRSRCPTWTSWITSHHLESVRKCRPTWLGASMRLNSGPGSC